MHPSARTTERAATAPSRWNRSGNRRLAGLLGVVFGTGWFLQETRILGVTPGWDLVLALVLVALGVGLLATPRAPRRIWPFVLGGFLVISLSGDDVSGPTARSASFGDSTYVARGGDGLPRSLEHAVGDLHVEIARSAVVDGEEVLTVRLGAGEVFIDVDDGVRVRLRARAIAGDVQAYGRTLAEGVLVEVDQEVGEGEERSTELGTGDRGAVLVIDVQVGFGSIHVRERART